MDTYKDTLKVSLLVYELFPKIHSPLACHLTGAIENHKACTRFSQTIWTICCFINL